LFISPPIATIQTKDLIELSHDEQKDLYTSYNNYITMQTTIQVKDKTLKRLKFFKEYSKESYDEIINKLIGIAEEGELTDLAVQRIRSGLEDIKAGRVVSLESYAKKRGISL